MSNTNFQTFKRGGELLPLDTLALTKMVCIFMQELGVEDCITVSTLCDRFKVWVTSRYEVDCSKARVDRADFCSTVEYFCVEGGVPATLGPIIEQISSEALLSKLPWALQGIPVLIPSTAANT